MNQQAELVRCVYEAEQAFRRRNPRSAEQLQIATQYMPGGNTRSVLFYEPFPLVMVSGEGSRLADLDGHSYIDFLGEYTAGLFGHSNPVIQEAIHAAVGRGLNLGAHNAFEAQLAKTLCDRFPSLELVRFTNSGSEANLMAVGTAMCFTGRKKVLVFAGAYHGSFMNFGKLGGPLNVPHAFVIAPYNDGEAASKVFQDHGADLAAVVIEPMLGSSGCIPAHREFLQLLRAESTKWGGVLIFDEVMTSRLSAGGLQQKLDILPDMTTLGKYIGGGSSFGAFGGRKDLMAQFDPRQANALPHAGTFNNNAISMAAGVVALTQVYTASAAAELNRRGDELRDRLNGFLRDADAPLQFTGVGSLMNAHITKERIDRPVFPTESEQSIKSLLFFHLLEGGYYIAPRGFITLSLPHTDADLEGFFQAIQGFVGRYKDLWLASTRAICPPRAGS